MKLKINSRGIGNVLLIALLVLLIIHILVLSGVLSPDIIWDTTITDTASVVISEWIAIFFILLFVFGILLKLNYLPIKGLRKSADSILWIMSLYYMLNIIGNFMSDNPIEKLLYAPLTLIMILMALRLIFAKDLDPKRRRKPQKRPQKIRRAS
ncbi:hypothetical protein [Eubacterium sp. 1001713B170207_170306_E7]|uniref:hypothetical protein n=1 Tax=Eubacterium sp. 1001713B170207_170306_E7 TaxID=2787097 RepID=UPI00189B02F9|nr:hypothetical protein [Eubacterium sp. 1001713B170207_170306_E7]